MFKSTRLLDCTLRDGGYYTDWDFDSKVVEEYIRTTNVLPIDYLEIGYRNVPSTEYIGQFGYCPVSVLRSFRERSTKKLAMMLNEKSTKTDNLKPLLQSIKDYIDMVRIAVDPKNFKRALQLAKAIKDYGFEVAFNMMYMSKWKMDYPDFLSELSMINGVADLFCMVDSFGGATPEEVKAISIEVKAIITCKTGFHGHNNLQLGLINTLTAISCGVDFVDATALGMGRGAGNLNMELLLTYLKNEGLEVDFNVLGDYVSAFQPLMDKYRWGTNLPYMIAGANCIPQKEVMGWVQNRAYSFNSIVRALDNQREKKEDNARYPLFEVNPVTKVLIVGGGRSVTYHIDAVREYIKNNPDMPLIFVTARHAQYFIDLPNTHYYILVGNEAKRMQNNLTEEQFKGSCILAPYPRKMGTVVPSYAENNTFELKEISFTSLFMDSCTTIALQTGLNLNASDIKLIGYDGYKGNVLSEKEAELTNENRTLFSEFQKANNRQLVSLTPTLYSDLKVESIYQYL